MKNATETNKGQNGPTGAASTENATMYGKIYFMDLDQLTSFLAKWAEEKNTAIFEVKQDNTMRWVLEFTGGY